MKGKVDSDKQEALKFGQELLEIVLEKRPMVAYCATLATLLAVLDNLPMYMSKKCLNGAKEALEAFETGTLDEKSND